MVAVRTTLTANDLPDNLDAIRSDIERAVPHGRTNQGQAGDRGAWANVPASNATAWQTHLHDRFEKIVDKHPKIGRHNAHNHLCSLGSGNHFIEVCLDEEDRVWVMLHSGSRGVGNRIGQLFINKAKEEMEKRHQGLPDKDLAWLDEGTEDFDDYIEAMTWAQDFAALNRKLMLDRTLDVLRKHLPPFQMEAKAINCHHNYASHETTRRRCGLRARVR
jgi:tRNA-splicing ligase RtcB